MNSTVNNSHLRAMNQRTILEAIFQRESVSRAELARMLNMSKPAMAVNVSELISIGVVSEIGEGSVGEGGGRKPILLRFNKNFRYIIAIDFYYSSSIFVLCNLRGEVLNRFAIRQTPQQNFESWVDMCRNAIMTLLASENLTTSDLASIGVSSPGIINDERQIFINSTRFGDYNIPRFYHALTESFRCPVYIKNSTNASALGEWDSGAGRGITNLLYLSCGQGLGSGMILNGEMYEGGGAAAGEIAGFITSQSIGQTKTLEERICISGLVERVRRETGNATADFDEVVELWRQGNAFVAQCIKDIATELGCVLCNMIMILNCDRVIFGGEYLAFRDVLLPRLNEMVGQYCIIATPVVASALGDSASGTGMVTICRRLFFDKISNPAQNGVGDE